jgi:hypothetical protein
MNRLDRSGLELVEPGARRVGELDQFCQLIGAPLDPNGHGPLTWVKSAKPGFVQ